MLDETGSPICVCAFVCSSFIILTESLLDKFLMRHEIQRFDARVATIKHIFLQICGVSFKKKWNDVNSKRQPC